MSRCTATYRATLTYSPPTHAVIQCERTDALIIDGRHRGQHHGFQAMPGGERRVSISDPDKPGWSKWGTETYPAWTRMWTWDQGGAQGSSAHPGQVPIPCPACGTPRYAEAAVPAEAVLYTGAPDAYAVAGDTDAEVCYHCRLWAERVENYTAGWQARSRKDRRLTRLIRTRDENGTPSPRLSAWAEGVTGAFGDRRVTVRWDDGDQRGPASSMWDCGAIPWWLDEHFPPNAVLVPSPAATAVGSFGAL